LLRPLGPVDAACVIRTFQPNLMGAALPHNRFHDPRHGTGTFLLAHDLTLEDVKNLLGQATDAVLGG
jgi:hypothetical protein